MITRFGFLALALLCLLLSAPGIGRGRGQQIPVPRDDVLLNGLKVIVYSSPQDPNVLLKLRVHGGAKFDLAGKEGTMSLLGGLLFTEESREFVETLGGRISVATGYDHLDITLAAPSSNLERLLELLSNAVTNPPLNSQNVTRVRQEQDEALRTVGTKPQSLAGQAILARLYDAYPYGRPYEGTPASLDRIRLADLLLARERFLNPNNSALVIAGGVEFRRAARAARQLLGSWNRSETVVPPTFKEAPPVKTPLLVINVPEAERAELRIAARSVPRSDADYAATQVLAAIARERWGNETPAIRDSGFFVSAQSHELTGVFVLGASVRPGELAHSITSARTALGSLARVAASPPEMEIAKRELNATLIPNQAQPDWLADLWLDEAFKIPAFDANAIAAVSPGSVARVAARLFLPENISSVVAGDAKQILPVVKPLGPVDISESGF